MRNIQRGMTLLEVLLAVAVVASGTVAAAALQAKALQASEAARREGQALMVQYSEHERRRP